MKKGGGKMTKQKLALAITTLTLFGSMFATTPLAYAQGPGEGNNNFFQGLISFISQKFNLDKTQVQNAVTDYRNQNKPTPKPTLTPDQIQAREKQRLDKLVSNGKITSGQETAILNELSSLRSKYNISSLSGQDKINKMKEMQAELKTWATNNNISWAYVSGFGMFGGMREGDNDGFGRRFEHKNWTTPTPTP